MNKFLVLGASGMAGHVVSIYLSEQGNDVVGLSRTPVDFVKNVNGDVYDDDFLKEIIYSGDFDIVVNAIGILNKDADNHKDRAVYLNGYLPHRLAALTENMNTRVFHMSTDCVFAGNTGTYTEGSLPDGRTFYDRSKAMGELQDSKNLTLRNSLVGPDINPKGIGLFNWFMKQEDSVSGFTRAMWTGMTTLELAKAMEVAVQDGSTGLVNMVPEGNISKYELLCLFNENFRYNSIEIRPSKEFILDKTLVRENFTSAFRPKPYRQQVAEMADWMRSHKNLYPHYGLE